MSIHLSFGYGMGTEHEAPAGLPEVWTSTVREDGITEWTNAKGDKRYAPPGKKVTITRAWWKEIKKMPDFEEVMRRKGLTEDEVHLIG
jgi:hypothetical protein